MPAVGMIAGGIVAWGADPRHVSTWTGARSGVFLNVALGALMAAAMNAGSNGLNQIFDLEIDRINKPDRPLPSGRLALSEAWSFTGATLAMGLLLAWLVNWQCLILAAAALLLTACYSAPPARTKRWGILANLTVAIPRGLLLMVAGWSTVKTAALSEPWLLATPLGLFFFGASSTKDFSDVPGDRAGGCRTLPVRYGVRTTALVIAPFFVFPFLLWGVFGAAGYLSAPALGIYALSAFLPVMGAYIDFRILRNPEELGSGENHLSWKLIYLMAIIAYGGLAVVYSWPRPA
jgi:4-hydroxybenzoate polyprenyltransferase